MEIVNVFASRSPETAAELETSIPFYPAQIYPSL
jgi:hypothetical protein